MQESSAYRTEQRAATRMKYSYLATSTIGKKILSLSRVDTIKDDLEDATGSRLENVF
jgi:hypothetical protein